MGTAPLYDELGDCLKRGFGSRRGAHESVRTMGKRVRIYRCWNCGRWHVSAYAGAVVRMGRLDGPRRVLLRARHDRALLVDDGGAPEAEHDEPDQDDERPAEIRHAERGEHP